MMLLLDSGKKQSTLDCVFLLNTAIAKSKKIKKPLHIASIDLEKAYDMVDRSKLFAKLQSLGYRGKSLEILKSLYYNDQVQVNVNGRLSKPLFLSLGVKQGCSLSPILFALYVDDLVRSLHETGAGVPISKEILSVLTFADDILCLSVSKAGIEEQ